MRGGELIYPHSFYQNLLPLLFFTLMKLNEINNNPDNPRTITDYNFDKLIESILSFPVMMGLRPIVINKCNIVIGGNQRFSALKEVSEMSIQDITDRLSQNYKFNRLPEKEQSKIITMWSEWLEDPTVNAKLADSFSESEEREFIIKDNIHYGEDDIDILKENFDIEEIESYLGRVDQLLYDFEDINDEDIESDPVELNKFKCGYVVSTLTNVEYNWLVGQFDAQIKKHGTSEFFVEEVLL